MDIKLGPARLSLARGEIVRIDHARGSTVRGVAGVLWVTQAEDLQDYFLRPGERIRINTNGPVVIHAVRAGTFRVERAQSADGELEPWWNPFQRSPVGLRV